MKREVEKKKLTEIITEAIDEWSIYAEECRILGYPDKFILLEEYISEKLITAYQK